VTCAGRQPADRQTFGSDGLAGQDLLSYEIFVKNAKDELEGYQFPGWMMPINQFGNIAGFVAQLGSGTNAQPFRTVQDYDNWHKRASHVPAIFEPALPNIADGLHQMRREDRETLVRRQRTGVFDLGLAT